LAAKSGVGVKLGVYKKKALSRASYFLIHGEHRQHGNSYEREMRMKGKTRRADMCYCLPQAGLAR